MVTHSAGNDGQPYARDTDEPQQQLSSNPVMRLIQRHYGTTEYKRSEKQIENERTFFCGQPFNRWAMFPAAVIIQFCCGSLYAWSVFNQPIDNYIYDNPNEDRAPITFYVAVGLFGVSTAIMGPWLERHGPRNG
ncbi:hypothetical protein THASP1DRAFT_32915, partial [Thamnocephalis sphaerospora]